MLKRTKTLVAAGGVALVLAGTGAGIAAAQTSPTPAPAPAPTSPANPTPKAHAPGAKPGAHHAKGLLSKVEHGEFTTHTKKGDKVFDVQRGTVTATDPGTISVKSVDGSTATYKIDNTTKVHKDKKQATAGDVKTNDRVTLTAVKAGDTVTAQHIGDAGVAK